MASFRYERRVAASADTVWNVVRRPESIPEWFPGIVSCEVDGTRRTVHLASGLALDEEILAIDDVSRRFVYRASAPILHFHLGVIDVFDLGADSLVSYSTTAEPDALALVIAGGTAGALVEIARLAEADAP